MITLKLSQIKLTQVLTKLSHTDENESNAMELIAETVGDISDSFTLLKAIDTEIIENYDGASEDMSSDDSFKDPS